MSASPKADPVIAFDRASARSFDKDGRLRVDMTNISKACVSPYLGNEIPGWESLGLLPEKVYKLYRDPEELAKGEATFRGIPLLIKHIYVSAETPEKESVVGSVGTDVSFDAPYLKSSLSVWDAEAIAMIESGALEELSCGYHYKPEMKPGTTSDGEAYDGRMIDIVGNHLALVERGRAGSDVIVADALPIGLTLAGGGRADNSINTAPKKEIAMKQTKLGRALHLALAAASPKIAKDSLASLVGAADKKTDRKAVTKSVLAMDSDLKEEVVEGIIEAIMGVEEEEVVAVDENDGGAKSKHAEIIDYLRGKGLDTSDLEAVGAMLTRMDSPPATDEEVVPKEDVDKKVASEVKTAMDGMRKEFRDLEVAKSAVRATVGDVLGMDSAEAVYRFALGHMKIDHKAMPAAGLPTLFAVASAQPAARQPVVAMDSKTVEQAIPGLARFK